MSEFSDLFFGRTTAIANLYEFVSSHTLTVVLGASGSGKSSLVKAGLVPYLKQQSEVESDRQWQILAPFRPGESPRSALNNTLARENLAGDSITQLDIEEKVATLSTPLAAWSQQHPNTKMLLVIDQFEELITLCKDDQERENFLTLLAEAVAKYPEQLRLVLTLRSDFEPQFRDTALKDYWDASRFVVSPMTRGELREAIENPAEARVMYFQQYLNRQCEAEKVRRTIDRALTQRADEEYEALVKEDPAYAQIIRQVMLRMVAIGGGELARRRVPLSELEYPPEKNGLVKEVIERFMNARLLVKGEDADRNPYVEPVHDALVTGWAKIKYWLDEKQEIVEQVSGWNPIKNFLNASLGKVPLPLTSKENSSKSDRPEAEKQLKVNLPLQRELTTAANNWSRKQKSDGNKQAIGFFWDRDPRLPQLEQIQQSDDNWLNDTETKFVQASIVQRRWNIAWIVIWVGIVFSVAIGIFGYQLILKQLRDKAARAENLLSRDPVEGLAVAIDAIGQNRSTPVVNFFNKEMPEVESSLLSAVQTARERYRFNQLAQSTSNQQGQPENNQQEQQVSQVSAVAVSPDGKTFASADKSGNVYLWDSQGKLISQPSASDGNSSGFSSLSFSPDGSILIGSGETKINNASPNQEVEEVKIWDLQQNKLIQPFGSDSSNVIAAAFSPDGKMIVSGGRDGTIQLWDLQGNKLSPLSPKIKSDNPQINAVAFSPDEKSIVSADQDGNVRLWKLQGGKILGSPTLIGDRKCTNPRSVAISSNSQQIICNLVPDYFDYFESGFDNESSVTLWNWDSQENKWNPLALKGGNSGFLSKVLFASFSPEGNTIVTGDQDGSIRLWNSKGKPIGQPLLGNRSNVESVAFSSDGKKIISGSWDGSIRLWDVEQNLSEEKRFGSQNSSYAFLQVACNRLRDHPILKVPNTEEAKGAKETCEKYVWNIPEQLSTIPSPAASPLAAKDFLPSLQAIAQDYYTRGNEQADREYIKNFPNIIAKSFTKAQKADAYVNRGVIYFRQKKYPQAIEDYNQAIALAPKHIQAYINRGIAYSSQGNQERAIADYDEALKIDPDNADAYYAKGFTLALQKGKKQEALEAYKKAEKLYPKPEKTKYSDNARKKYEELSGAKSP